jgi:cell division GTPase FtsZ
MHVGVAGLGVKGTYLADELSATWAEFHETLGTYIHNNNAVKNDVSEIPTEHSVYMEGFDKPGTAKVTREEVREWVRSERSDGELYTIFDQLYLGGNAVTQHGFGSIDLLVVAFDFGEAMGGGLADVVADWTHDRQGVPVLGVGFLPPTIDRYVRNADAALDPVVSSVDHCLLVDKAKIGGTLIETGVFEVDDPESISTIEMTKEVTERFGRAVAPVAAAVTEPEDLERYVHGDVSTIASGRCATETDTSGLLSRFVGSEDGPTAKEAHSVATRAVDDAVATVPTTGLDPSTAYSIVLILSGPDSYLSRLAQDELRTAVYSKLADEYGVSYPEERIAVECVESAEGEVTATVYYQDIRNVGSLKRLREMSEEIREQPSTDQSSEEELKGL